VIYAGNSVKVAVQLNGTNANSSWKIIPWVSGSPFATLTEYVRAIDQSLSTGQAALYVHIENASPADAPSVGGGSLSFTGSLPTVIGANGTITLGLTNVQLSANLVVNGTVQLNLGKVLAQ
jgi:hypothetical protein